MTASARRWGYSARQGNHEGTVADQQLAFFSQQLKSFFRLYRESGHGFQHRQSRDITPSCGCGYGAPAGTTTTSSRHSRGVLVPSAVAARARSRFAKGRSSHAGPRAHFLQSGSRRVGEGASCQLTSCRWCAWSASWSHFWVLAVAQQGRTQRGKILTAGTSRD